MRRCYNSAVINAPCDTVWTTIRIAKPRGQTWVLTYS